MTDGDFRRFWALDPAVIFLNHGSFGACPKPVLAAQRCYRDQIEAEPVRFFVRELEPLLDAARAELATFIGAEPADLAFVPNATAGINAVLRSAHFEPGDELLTTDHEYNACRNALTFVAAEAGAQVVVAAVPFPLESAERVVEAVLAGVTPRTKLALLDHVTSQTALVFPIERIVADLRARGIETLVDGAHAPGMVPLDVTALGAAYYAGNCHKWVCAPKGAGFLHVRRDKQVTIHPAVISHGTNSPRTERSRYLLEFDWTGTADPTPFLCVPEALHFMGGLLPGGWPALMAANREKASSARRTLCFATGIDAPCPDDMLGAMGSIPLPDGDETSFAPPLCLDPLQDLLFERHAIEVPIIAWPKPPRRLLRVSAQIYNRHSEYQMLADALAAELL